MEKKKEGEVKVLCEIFNLSDNLHLVNFSKMEVVFLKFHKKNSLFFIKGPLKVYLKVYQRIFEKLPSNFFE